jgi:hypothetical protein
LKVCARASGAKASTRIAAAVKHRARLSAHPMDIPIDKPNQPSSLLQQKSSIAIGEGSFIAGLFKNSQM